MNELFLRLGLEPLKPIFTALLLPPMPFLALALLGLILVGRHRRVGWVAGVSGLVLAWLSGCHGFADAVAPILLNLPPAISNERIAELNRQRRGAVAIIVLGSGVEPWAQEYRDSDLSPVSLERLRYGVWLGRKTGWPVGFSGGIGWGQLATNASVAEGTVAARVAREEFRQPLRWVEATSRDTRENALNTLAMLRPLGVRDIVLVTNDWHMQRAVRNFQRAVGRDPIRIEPAPMGLPTNQAGWVRWIPSGRGLTLMSEITREWLGWLAGA